MSFDPDDPKYKFETLDVFQQILNELQKITFLLSLITDIEPKELDNEVGK